MGHIVCMDFDTVVVGSLPLLPLSTLTVTFVNSVV